MGSYLIISFYIAVVCLLFGFSIQLRSKRARKWFIILTFGVMCTLMALRRHDVGNDTMAYISFFKLIRSGNYWYDPRIEVGFRYLTIYISKITGNEVVYMTILVCLAFIPQIILISKLVYRIDIAAVLFWLLLCVRICSVQRQGIAMGIIAVGYLVWRKKYKFSLIFYMLCCIVATLFHTSAIVMIIMPFLCKRRINTRIGWWAIVLSVVLASTNVVERAFVMFGGDYYSRYSTVQSGWLASTFNLLIGCVAYYLSCYLKCNNEKLMVGNLVTDIANENTVDYEDSYMEGSAILFSVTSILSVGTGIMGRIALYFVPFIIVLLANEFREEYRSNLLLELGSIFALFGYNVLALIIRPEWNSFFPFYFFWQH